MDRIGPTSFLAKRRARSETARICLQSARDKMVSDCCNLASQVERLGRLHGCEARRDDQDS